MVIKALNNKEVFNNFKYISLMIFAAIITLTRGFMLAGILDLTSFGIYITTIAIGMFLSIILSFGDIENTIKVFPRLWLANNQCNQILSLTNLIQKKIIYRSVSILLLIILLTTINDLQSFFSIAIFCIITAFNASLSSIYASAIRAIGETNLISRNTLYRAVLALFFSLIGATILDWQGAIIGETLGVLFWLILSRQALLKRTHSFFQKNNAYNEAIHINQRSSTHLWLFSSSLLTAIPAYLDRPLVASTFGSDAVGTFGFLMLFVVGANTFTGIIIQKIGPQIIKMEQLGSSIQMQIKYAARWILFIWLVCLIGIATIITLLQESPANFYFIKFNLDLNLMGVTTVMCLLQISVIADLIILSRNHERLIFNINLWYAILFGVSAIFLITLNLSLLSFLWLLAIIKLFQLILQVYYTLKIRTIYS